MPISGGQPWPGVGHVAREGNGARNGFGQDFQAANFQWTTELCQKDSDCDGKSNGEELGDPDCIWTPGATPGAPTGHPGQPGAAGDVISTCDDFDAISVGYPSDSPDRITVSTRLPSDTVVPSKHTSYMKFGYNITREILAAGGIPTETYYGIKFTPKLDNVLIDHHMILYSCGGGASGLNKVYPASVSSRRRPWPD